VLFFRLHISRLWLENSYLNIPPGQIQNIFLQDICIPISSRTRLPDQIKRMITTACKYKLKFTALSISQDVKLQMPIWKHPAVRKCDYDRVGHRHAAVCLRLNHNIRSVKYTLTIATCKTMVTRKPHVINPSEISRQNCGCPSCQLDRVELGCKHPGKCIDAAKILIDSIHPKSNLTKDNQNLCGHLFLIPEEIEINNQPAQTGEIKTFDPNFTLNNLEHGFRIFAFGEALNEVPA
jgi:hypothetical protein